MEHVAKLTGKSFDAVQELNFYNAATSPKTPFGDTIGKDGFNWTIPQLYVRGVPCVGAVGVLVTATRVAHDSR